MRDEKTIRLWLGRHQVSSAGLWVYIKAVLPYLLTKLTDYRFRITVAGAGTALLKREIDHLVEEIEGQDPNSPIKIEWRTTTLGSGIVNSLSRYIGHIRDLFVGVPQDTLIHGMSNTVPLGGGDSAVRIMTVHDLLQPFPTILPKSPKARLKTEYYRWYLLRAINECRTIVTGHEKTVGEITEWTEKKKSEVTVVYPPLDEVFFHSEPKSDHSEPYLLTFVSKDPRKNFARTFEAFESSTAKETHTLVVVVGNQEVLEDVRGTVRDSTVSERVYIVFQPRQARLISLYRNGSGTLFPSLGEGFGYPIYESLSQGVPVLTSRDLLAEPFTRAKEMVCLADPTSVDSIRDGIESLISLQSNPDKTSAELVTAIREELRRELHPERCAEKLVELYRSAIE